MNNQTMTGPAPEPGFAGIRRSQATDVDEHAHNLSSWQLRYDQLTPGRFDGELTELRCDWMRLDATGARPL